MPREDSHHQLQARRRLEAVLRSGRMPHAYLFVGPAGTGRLSLARTLAAALLCREAGDGLDCCGACRNCRTFLSGNHPDYREVGVPAGKQRLPIDVIRSVQQEASLKPLAAPRRVFVIREAEKMNPEAANCFLKTLEEPPGACVFVLIATGVWSLPPTIVSRCQVVKLSGLEPREAQRRLESAGLEQEKAWWLARRSWGSLGLAQQFDEAKLYDFNQQLLEKLEALTLRDNFALSEWLQQEARTGTESRAQTRALLQEMLECVAMYYRDFAVTAVAPEESDVLNPLPASKEHAAGRGRPAGSAINMSRRHVESVEVVLETIERIAGNANERLALDDMFTRLARLAEAK